MIKFLASDTSSGREEKVIVVQDLPATALIAVEIVKLGATAKTSTFLKTNIIDEVCVQEIAPINFANDIGKYIIHTVKDKDTVACHVYVIEQSNFRHVKKFIAPLSLFKGAY